MPSLKLITKPYIDKKNSSILISRIYLKLYAQNLKFCISFSFTYKFEIKLRINFRIKLLICLKEVGELNLRKTIQLPQFFISVDIKEY